MPRRPQRHRRAPSMDTLMLDLKQDLAIANASIGSVLSEQTEARASRHLMHEKLDDVRDRLTRHDEILSRIAPLVDKHEDYFQQGAGQRRLIGGLFKLRHMIWIALAAFLAFLGFHFPKPP